MGLDWDPDGDAQRRRENRGRVLLAITLTVMVLGYIVRLAIKSHDDRERDRAFQRAAELNREITRLPPTPPTSRSELADTTRRVCELLLRCGDPNVKLDDCVALQSRGATDDFSRDVIVMANKRVLAECGSASCATFGDCYMDAIKHAAGATGPSKPVAPEFAARFTKLVCEVAAENVGRVPDLDSPSASAKAHQLKAMMLEVGDPSALADLMKQAMASCGAGPAAR